MTQNWRKLGTILRPDTSKAWNANGWAHCPTPVVLGDIVRVYYASLDAHNRGSIGFVDLDGNDLTKVRYTSPDPVLTAGRPGVFDCDGVVPSCVVDDTLYYFGFQRTEAVPYMIFAGEAAMHDDGARLVRVHNAPILDRSDNDPYIAGAPFVIGDDMWYTSCTHWSDGHYNNVIKRAAYDDEYGPEWINGSYAIVAVDAPDYAATRPWVIREGGRYRMWYSIRSVFPLPGYRMGYAESANGLSWTRRDGEVASLIPDNGDDAEYAAIVDSGGKRWMVYNGAGRGKGGIELAILEDE